MTAVRWTTGPNPHDHPRRRYTMASEPNPRNPRSNPTVNCDPVALVRALTEFGFTRGPHLTNRVAALSWPPPSPRLPLRVPLDRRLPDYRRLLDDALAELTHAARVDAAADANPALDALVSYAEWEQVVDVGVGWFGGVSMATG